MGRSYGNTGGSGSIFWTDKYQNNVNTYTMCSMYNTADEYVFYGPAIVLSANLQAMF